MTGDPLPAPFKPRDREIEALLRQRLIEARIARGWRQRDLASVFGRAQTFVSNYESGKQRLRVWEFIEISLVLGLDPAEIIREIREALSAVPP